jgi:hypothetical protein
MRSGQFKPLLAVSESYILEVSADVTHEMLAYLLQIVDHFISGVLTFDRASALFIEKVHTNRPIERIYAILNVPDTPIPAAPPPPQFAFPAVPRRRAHPWSEYEDQRLLAAIHRFGLDSWPAVSLFVGNLRTRAQCSQRWFRGLDPRISKVLWTDAEERQLLALVRQHGDRAWTRIASELGNRSDAQCRYHYHQLMKVDMAEGGCAALEGGIARSKSEPVARLHREVMAISASTSAGMAGRIMLPSIHELMKSTQGDKGLGIVGLPAGLQKSGNEPQNSGNEAESD